MASKVPYCKNYLDGTVPSSKNYLDGTVPSSKKLVDGTSKKMFNIKFKPPAVNSRVVRTPRYKNVVQSNVIQVPRAVGPENMHTIFA